MKANWDLLIRLGFFATIVLSASSEKEMMDVFYMSKNIWIHLPTACQKGCLLIHIYIYLFVLIIMKIFYL